MFVDEVKIKVVAWKWGNGLVSWRREKCIPNGGPRGGDGGNGGTVILRTNPNINTLSEYRHKKVLRAEDGQKGGLKLMHGANAPDLYLDVPVWTLVKDAETGELIVDLSEEWKNYPIVYGGRGWFGNAHFTSSTRQAPWFAEVWDIGEENEIILELKLVADIGIIGIPSSWKSSLISVITSVKPKIGDYPFTTLVPNLGVLEHKGKSLVIEDVPGLIKGASEWKGLWIQFLKHIERTRVLVHLLDLSRLDKIFEDYTDIRNELWLFSEDLVKKEEIILFSKADLLDEEMRQLITSEFIKKFKPSKYFVISSATSYGIEAIKDFFVDNVVIEKIEASEEVQKIERVYDLREYEDPKNYFVDYEWDYKFRVSGKRIEQIVRMTDFANKEWVMRVIDVLDKIGAIKKIQSQLDKVLKENEVNTDYYFEGNEDKEVEPKVIIWDREISLAKLMYNL